MNVFWHLPQQADVSRTMQTSKSFYAAGIKPLLHAGVSIKDMRALVSFCRLILSDIPARAPHVRRLELCIEAEPEDYDEYRDYLTSVVQADHLVMAERAAYDKLLPVQGSLVPWFYGVHKVSYKASGIY